MVARIAVGDGDDARVFSFLRPSILPTYRKRGRIHMYLLCSDAEDLPGACGDPGKQLGQIVGIQPVQRAPQAINTLASRH